MDKKDYGDFEEIGDEITPSLNSAQSIPTRVKMPGKGEVIGIVSQRLGGNRMEVHCTDGKIRNCRVPGRFKRSMWLREKDFVLVKPWDYDNGKADIIYHYNSSSVNQLRKRGLLNNIKSEF